MAKSAIVDISSAIRVRHIMTPIDRTVPFTRTDRVADAREFLRKNQFDVAPVFPTDEDPEIHAGPASPDGIVRRVQLDRLSPDDPIQSAVRPLSSESLIGGEATVNALLSRFREKHTFLLVVGSAAIEGLVTPSDLNKQAGRTHLFMHVSALELALADIVRKRRVPDNEILTLVQATRMNSLASRYRKKVKVDEAADLVAAFDLQDLLWVCRSGLIPYPIFAQLTDKQIELISNFRNGVMHGVLKPAGDSDDKLRALLEHDSLVTELVACAEAVRDDRSSALEISTASDETR